MFCEPAITLLVLIHIISQNLTIFQKFSPIQLYSTHVSIGSIDPDVEQNIKLIFWA
jgi:hypothetical protein